MNTIRFVKSFSKGQITIPKEIRDTLGIANEFWLKVYVDDRKIIAEPVDDKRRINRKDYLKVVMGIKGSWDLAKEIKNNRKQLEERFKEHEEIAA